MIKKAEPSDLDALVNIHLTSWHPREFSVKMGEGFVRLLYRNIIESPLACCYIYVENDQIIGYAVAYYHYREFNRNLKSVEILKAIVVGIISGRVSLSSLINNIFLGERKFRKARYPNYHLGALALSNEYKSTPMGRIAITEVIKTAIGSFRQKQFPGCSIICDENNIPLRKYLDRFGFQLQDSVPMIGRVLVLYEVQLDIDSD